MISSNALFSLADGHMSSASRSERCDKHHKLFSSSYHSDPVVRGVRDQWQAAVCSGALKKHDLDVTQYGKDRLAQVSNFIFRYQRQKPFATLCLVAAEEAALPVLDFIVRILRPTWCFCLLSQRMACRFTGRWGSNQHDRPPYFISSEAAKTLRRLRLH